NIQTLWAAGARHFMVLDIPDPALAPFVRSLDPAVQAAATQTGLLHNVALDAALAQVSALPGLQLLRFDVGAALERIVRTRPEGVTNVTEPCLRFGVLLDTVCAHPQHHLFWDGAHPTHAGHRLLGEAAQRLLDDDPDGK